MQDISSLLQSRYGLLCNDVTETVGGLSADAFRIIAGREKYFLKVYKKRMCSLSFGSAISIDICRCYLNFLKFRGLGTGFHGRL